MKNLIIFGEKNRHAMSAPIQHHPESRTFFTTVEGHRAHLSYRIEKKVMDLYHTHVPPPIEGRGIAARLVETALEYAREKDFKIRATCWFVDLYIRRHPQYEDLRSE